MTRTRTPSLQLFTLTLLFVSARVAFIKAADSDVSLMWKEARELSLGGLSFFREERENDFDRLPLSAKSRVPSGVWQQSVESAGVHVDFETDASEIWIDYTLLNTNTDFTNMDGFGVSGIDILAFDTAASSFRWLTAWGANLTFPINYGRLVNELHFPAEKTLYRINFPLYNRVQSFRIGVPTSSKVFSPAPSTLKSYPIVWYGTSIAQGKAAQVASSAYITQLNLANYPSLEILNFGFSSNGKMDPSVMAYLNRIPSVRAFIIDCLPNMNSEEVANRTVPLVHSIRESHTDQMPIVLVESAIYANEWFNDSARQAQQKKRDALKYSFETLVKEGVTNLYYVQGKNIIPAVPVQTVAYQVDGTHPTDLGMYIMFQFWNQHLPAILSGNAPAFI